MKTKLLKKGIFIQDYGIYSDEVLVLVNIQDKQEIFKFLKKEKAKVNFSKWVLNDFDFWQERLKNGDNALFCFNNDVKGTVLVLKQPTDTWEYWETLMHEIHHMVHKLSKDRTMLEEIEAQAYLFEYLFKSIRKKLTPSHQVGCEIRE